MQAIPQATPTTVISIKIPHHLYVAFKRHCDAKNTSMSRFIRRAIERAVARDKKDATR